MDRSLYNAATAGDVESLTQLLADVNGPQILSQVTRRLKNTALHIAAGKGRVDFVSTLLLSNRCILLVRNSKQETSLHAAAKNGATKVVEVLLRIPRENYAQCRCPSCAQSGVIVKSDVERNPIDSQLFFRAQNSEGNTALHMAAQGGYVDVVERLLTKDKELARLVNKAGEAPLFTAAQNGHLDIVKRLLGISTPICDTDNGGRTPLHAAIHRKHFDVVNELLDKKPGLAEQADGSGCTPLHLAAEEGYMETARKILEKHKEACYSKNVDGMFAIHIAARNGRMEMVNELLSRNPDCIELLDGNGKTALHLCVESDHWDVARDLLKNDEASFLVNEPDREGNTILHTTISRLPSVASTGTVWKMIAVRTLLRRMLSVSGPSVNAENKKRQTALDIHDLYFGELWGFPYRGLLIGAGAVSGAKWQSAAEKESATKEKRPSKIRKQSDKAEVLKMKRETLAIVAAFIAGVTFAAGFTIRGGLDNVTGNPVLVRKNAFDNFVTSNALAFFISLLALCILLLSVYTKRYPLGPLHLFFSLAELYVGIACVFMLAALVEAVWLVVAPRSMELAQYGITVGVPCAILLGLQCLRGVYAQGVQKVRATSGV